MKKALSALRSAGLMSVILMPSVALAEIRAPEVVGTGDGMELVRLVGATYIGENPVRPVIVWRGIGSDGFTPGRKSPVFASPAKIVVNSQNAVKTVQSVEEAIGFGPFSRSLQQAPRMVSVDGRYTNEKAYPGAVTVSFVWCSEGMPHHANAFLQYRLSSWSQALLKTHGALPVA